MSEWIKNLKMGDTVVIANRYGMSLRKVAKITPTGRICVGSMTFNPDGVERGNSSWTRSILREATPERIAEIKADEAIHKAYTLMRNKTNISYEQAKKIIEILGGDNEQRD